MAPSACNVADQLCTLQALHLLEDQPLTSVPVRLELLTLLAQCLQSLGLPLVALERCAQALSVISVSCVLSWV